MRHMLMKGCAAGLAVSAAAGAGLAQSVEFRIVERQGQGAILLPVGTTPTTDGVLAFAVQARVVGGLTGVTSLGDFHFNIHIAGEPDGNGTLAKLLISNVDGTYAANTAQTTSATVGRGGLAAIYTYFAGINGQFNGLLNSSGGTFTNGPEQEIGLVTGSPSGGSLLLFVGNDGGGNIDWPNAPVARTYLGADSQWIDVYRFKYTVLNLTTARTMEVRLDNLEARVFNELHLANTVWQPVLINAPFSTTSTLILVGNTGACCDTTTGACTLVGSGGCVGGVIVATTTCGPTTCQLLGSCCVLSTPAVCTVTTVGGCNGTWVQGSLCSAVACPPLGTCCAGVACGLMLQNDCTGTWNVGGTCNPNPCGAFVGACCRGGACSVTDPATCVLFVGQYRGNQTTCPLQTDPNRCCVANFDGVGGVQVADIFAFMNAFFALDPHANVNADGVVSVQDIFDFLGAWWVGCP